MLVNIPTLANQHVHRRCKKENGLYKKECYKRKCASENKFANQLKKGN